MPTMQELLYGARSFHPLDLISIARHLPVRYGSDRQDDCALALPTRDGTSGNHSTDVRKLSVVVEVVNEGSCRPKESRGFAGGSCLCGQAGVGNVCGKRRGPAGDQHARCAGSFLCYLHKR